MPLKLSLALLALLGLLSRPLAAAERPNIIILFADDLGYGDLGCYGHPTIRTPNLDRMAAEGMRFTDFYSVAEVCTPSRAALLTGRYPVRSGMAHDQFRVLRPRSTGHLPADEVTLPEALKAQGYTTGMIGKWHLGVWSINPAGHPRRHGFDHFLGLPHSNDMDPMPGIPPRAPTLAAQDAAWWNSPLYRNEAIIERPADQTTLTRRYTEEAQQFIREHKRQPFLLYVAHTFPHTPLFASAKFRGTSRRGLYGDVVEELDWSVGQILETLRREKLDRRTLVFFTSDNGPWLTMNQQGGSAGLLRDGKGSTWEGGMRVPGIAWWPGRIKAGGGANTNLACMLDIFPTALKLAGAKLPGDRAIDGHDLSDLLLRSAPGPRRSMFYYRGARLYAVRKDHWKLHLFTQKGYGQPKPDAHEPPLLFNLNIDPGETFNVATNHPAVVSDLLKEIETHRATVTPAKSQLESIQPVEASASSPQPPTTGVLIRGELESELAPHGTGNIYAPEVHRDGGLWRMWYGGQGKDGHDRIHLAESRDGDTWTKRGVVLDCGTANHVNDPTVARVGGDWWMFYTVAESGELDEIAAATSRDGMQWEKRGVVIRRGEGNAWDSWKVGRPSVLHEGGVFRMWFDGQPTREAAAVDGVAGRVKRYSRAVGYAESRDGLTWKRRAEPVFLEGAGAVAVARDDARLVMVFESHAGTRWTTSPDGLIWEGRGLLNSLSGGDPDRFGQVTPFLWRDAGGAKLYFGAAARKTWDGNAIAAKSISLLE